MFDRALEYLLSAEEMYMRGFTENHPKVAWALEGIAKVHHQRGDLRQSAMFFEKAIALRKQIQDSGNGKKLFVEELQKAQMAVEGLTAQREKAQNAWQKRIRVAVGVG